MTDNSGGSTPGFHSGELAAQRRAGMETAAARMAPLLARGRLSAGIAAFLASAPFAAITARDHDGRLWTSPLIQPPGFLRSVSGTALQIDASPPRSDPLYGMPAGQPVGLIAIDFRTRRRVRVNGLVSAVDTGGLTVEVRQAYGNCPQYIHPRSVEDRRQVSSRVLPRRSNTLSVKDTQLVRNADTFVLGTTHPSSGNDASHRGGQLGFVTVSGDCLSWPDFPGNNMFNSLGNLSVDPTAALLFVDFASNATLHLSGVATVQWQNPHSVDSFDTGRRVEFTPQQVIATQQI